MDLNFSVRVRAHEKRVTGMQPFVVDWKDKFCIVPTGYGKSLIYQSVPFIFDVCLGQESCYSIIVISLLNSLCYRSDPECSKPTGRQVQLQVIGDCFLFANNMIDSLQTAV